MDWNTLKSFIQDMMEEMAEKGLSKIEIKHDNTELNLEKEKEVIHTAPVMTHVPAPSAHNVAPALPPVEGGSSTPVEDSGGVFIEAPVVGTFYTAPSPNDPPFVKPGDSVTEDTVVGIIEAMKVMNEVKAGLSGVIENALVENAQPVEFGTPLFKVR